mgnify:FL=1|jgi:translation initiation factor 2 beta subunit (eIF-2beta)/eIF-5
MDSFTNNGNLINIGGDPNDSFYRYKMPALKTQITGRGNGIKTILNNIKEVAKAIGHPEEIITKHICYTLGSNWDSKKGTMTGKHDTHAIQEIINDYILFFVLCESCKNPETMYFTEGKKKKIKLFIKCASCGFFPQVETCAVSGTGSLKIVQGKSNEKLINFIKGYISKNPMEISTEKKEYNKDLDVLNDFGDNIF